MVLFRGQGTHFKRQQFADMVISQERGRDREMAKTEKNDLFVEKNLRRMEARGPCPKSRIEQHRRIQILKEIGATQKVFLQKCL